MFLKVSLNFVQFISKNQRAIHVSTVMPKKQSKKANEAVSAEKKPLGPISLDKAGNIAIKVLAKPGSKINAVTDISEEGVGIQINAPPVDGEANTELIKYLSSILNIRKSDIQLDKGSRSRQKTIIVSQSKTQSVETVTEKLKSEIQS
ncbi:hypothetical protein J437_LFUL003470 [Ladona fulva]|uniref:Uncharacterized protein n=1 Tax=Ladona fulva TaxID=123851 RepID=A0A8K0JSE7_LADFU|nr:hypothetical protein J437_LFUL003470 [Ladona fulva]